MTTPKYKMRQWAKKGARVRKRGTRRVVPLETLLEERKKFGKELLEEVMIGLEENVRKAHCKLCGAILLPGEGTGFEILASDGYRHSKYYACTVCYPELEGYLIGGWRI